jgi:glycopeptide antibiotics resistance protein
MARGSTTTATFAGPVYARREPSATPAWLWLATTIFVVYSATIPFNFTFERETVAAHLARISLNPLLSPSGTRRLSAPDAVQNMLLFAPFGLFGVLTLRRRFSPAVAVTATAVLALLLAVLVETLQLFTLDRTTSTSDLLTNTLGALGAGITTVTVLAGLPRAFKQLRERGLLDVAAFYPMMIAAMVTTIAAWEPFDFTLDVGSVAGKVRAFFGDPWQFRVVNDEGVTLVTYTLLALALGLWLRQLRVRRPAPAVIAIGGAFAIVVEGTQIVIESRMPGIEDIVVHVAGVVAGALLAERWPLGVSSRAWLGILAIATVVAAALQVLSPFNASAGYRPPADFPFLGYYQRTTFETLSHVIELMLAYLPFGFCVALTSSGGNGWWMTTVIAAIVIALPIELAQGWVIGRYPDLTDVFVSALGALAGGWLGGPGQRTFERWRDEQAHAIEII